MALLLTVPDPFSGEPLAGCYARWGDLLISPRTRTVRVVFEVYRSEAARLAGRAPLPVDLRFEVGPSGVQAVTDPETGAVLAPAVPSYDEFAAAMGQTIEGEPGAADVIGALVYGYAKSRPELADAEDA